MTASPTPATGTASIIPAQETTADAFKAALERHGYDMTAMERWLRETYGVKTVDEAKQKMAGGATRRRVLEVFKEQHPARLALTGFDAAPPAAPAPPQPPVTKLTAAIAPPQPVTTPARVALASVPNDVDPVTGEMVEAVIRPGSKTFDPSKHLITLQHNAKYLPVNKRLLWLRSEQPDAQIDTELVQLTDSFALFKATVTLSNGASATGFGSETPADFADYVMKAETKAVGRALGALGYGTQFSPDLDDSESAGKSGDAIKGSRPRPISDKQLKLIFDMARAKGMGDTDIDATCGSHIGVARPEDMSAAQASAFIDIIKAL